jgi:general secretion pathway protein B
MSYILEALRKSERERQLKQAPSLAAAVTAEASQPSRSWLPWAMVAALVLLNGAAVAVFLLSNRSAPGSAAEKSPQPEIATPATPAPVPPTAVAPIQRQPPASTVAITPAPAAPAISAEPAAVEAPTSEQEPAPLHPAATPRLAEKPQRPRAMPAKPAAAAEAGDPEPAEDKPAYRINVLAYSSDPKDRFAVINMSRYVIGDRLPDGAVVDGIQADGVILVRGGKRLRIAH